jgi:hypothetical protein
MRFYVLTSIIFLTKINFAQVPNAGFEQWSSGNPDGWWTSNFTTPNITQSTDAHSGSYALRGDVINTGTGTIIPIIISGIIGGHGFPISVRYANLTGYYKLNVINTENLSVLAIPFRNGQVIGVGGFQFYAASAYTLFNVPIYYSNGETPDSCQISITIGNNSGDVNVGSYFLVDDLAFEGVATDVNGTENLTPNNITLEQNYPNPFNPSTTIEFSIPEQSFVNLEIFNSIGEKISTVISEELSAGSYKYLWNASNLPSGVYFYRLQSKSFIKTNEMLLLK